MNVLVIEDEAPAARRLCKMLETQDPSIQIVGIIESVRSGRQWFQENDYPDLIFSDIQLSDDLSFELLKELNTKVPIIFTTAYDEYAIQAFQHNSIDYLLKPVGEADLSKSLHKYREQSKPAASPDFETLLRSLGQKRYRERFLVGAGNHLIPVACTDVAFCYSEDGITFLSDQQGKRYMVNESLDQLESELDPHSFFRANRQFILSANAVRKVEPYFNQKLRVFVEPEPKRELIISKLKATAFKSWLNG